MKSTITKTAFDRRCAKAAVGMCGPAELTDGDITQFSKSFADDVTSRLRSGKKLTMDQRSALLACGMSPHALESEGLKKAKSQGISRLDEGEDLKKGGSRPTWALNEDAFWRTMQLAEDRGKQNDWNWIRRKYKRIAAGKTAYSTKSILRGLDRLEETGDRL